MFTLTLATQLQAASYTKTDAFVQDIRRLCPEMGQRHFVVLNTLKDTETGIVSIHLGWFGYSQHELENDVLIPRHQLAKMDQKWSTKTTPNPNNLPQDLLFWSIRARCWLGAKMAHTKVYCGNRRDMNKTEAPLFISNMDD